jgi:hypothetical protein
VRLLSTPAWGPIQRVFLWIRPLYGMSRAEITVGQDHIDLLE